MQAKALIIEDDPEIADLIRLYLENEGIRCRIAPDAERGGVLLEEEGADIVLLDLNLPGMDGFEFLQSLRRKNPVPVLVVSARDGDEDLVLGLGLGADDFQVKPFSPKVLVARVRALLRRSKIPGGRASSTDRIAAFGPFRLNLDDLILRRDGERVAVPSREMELLVFLAGHPERTFAPEELYEAVWGNAYGDITTVAVHVQRLRRRIESDPKDPRFLRTVHGRGYRFGAGGET